MELEKAIKELVALRGIELIKSKQFIYILDDMGAFKEEPPASKKVLKELLLSGFDELICRFHGQPKSSWQNPINKHIADYKIKSGYNEKLVDRLVMSLLTGSGLNAAQPQTTASREKKGSERWAPTKIQNDSINQPKLAEKKPHLAKTPKGSITKGKKKHIFIKMFAALILVFFAVQIVLYFNSSVERENYHQTMELGKSELKKDQYITALNLFLQAEEEYNVAYFPFYYRSKAHKQAVQVTDSIIAEWINEIEPILENLSAASNDNIVKAKILTLDLPSKMAFSPYAGNRYEVLSAKIEEELDRRIPQIFDELLEEIYSNQGKLSVSTKEKLEMAVKASPDNYWLNLIKDNTK